MKERLLAAANAAYLRAQLATDESQEERHLRSALHYLERSDAWESEAIKGWTSVGVDCPDCDY